MIIKEKFHGPLQTQTRRRPQGIIKPVSRTNQASGKVNRSHVRYAVSKPIAIP
jgi:hypothetical protein